MNVCTLSKLACEAGVSVHIVRDYVVRDLLHPAQRTNGGYGIYDAQALGRLRFVRAAFEASIGLHELTRLCHALDGGVGDAGGANVLAGTSVRAFVGNHWGAAALALAGLFVMSATRVLRFSGTSE